MKRIAKRQKGKQIQLWFQDETRVGQKGPNAHIWFEKGVRPVMRTDKRFKSIYVYGGEAFALILPRADTEMMRLYPEYLRPKPARRCHVMLVFDKVGRHVTGRRKPLDNITLVHLPAYSPELKLVERLWFYLKECFLSHRTFDNQHATIEVCAKAWNDLKAEAGASPRSPTPLHPKD